MATSYITDFIQSLSKEEIKVVQEFVYKPNEKFAENKMQKLFDILTQSPERKFSDPELSSLLGSDGNALRVLKSRMFEKTKEALLSDKYLENMAIFSEMERVFFSLKKKMLIARALNRSLNQGRIRIINNLLNEVIQAAKKYEFFELLREASIELKHVKGIRKGINEFEKIDKEITFYEYCFKSVKNANDAFYRLILNEEFISNLKPIELENHIRNSIKQMDIDFKFTKAKEINYYARILKIALFEKERKFKSAISECNKLLLLIKRNINLFTKRRVSFVFSNLSIFNVYIENYPKAIFYARKAYKFVALNSYEHVISQEQEFYALFYSGNYKNALNLNKVIIKHPIFDIGSYRQSKFFYQQAFTYVCLKDYKEARNLVSKSLEFEKDKTKWNIALRVLITMIFIGSQKYNQASTSIATLRKHIERNNKTKEIKQRDILIFKLLRELEKDGFKRNEKNKKASKLITELSDKDKPTAWNYFTPELIPFHEWVMTLPVKTA